MQPTESQGWCGATSKEGAPIPDVQFQQSTITAADATSTTKRIPLPQGGRIFSAKLTVVSADRPSSPMLIDCYVAYLRGDAYEGAIPLFTKWFAEDNAGHGARNPAWMGDMPLTNAFRPFLVVSIDNYTGTAKTYRIDFQVEGP